MPYAYEDLRTLHEAGQTDQQIATALATRLDTNQPIQLDPFIEYLESTALLILEGAEGNAGWFIAAYPQLAGPQKLAIDRTISYLVRRPAASIPTTDHDVAMRVLELAQVIQANPGLNPPVTFAVFRDKLLELSGGLKFAGISAAGVRAVIDAHEAGLTQQQLLTQIDEGYHRARTAVIDSGETVWANIVAAFDGGV